MPSGTVAIRLGAVEGAEQEIRKLARWLRDEDELRGRVRLESAPIEQGHMGGAVEAVVVVVTSGAASVFVRSLFDWLARRNEAAKVALTFESDDGSKIDLECGSAADAEKLLKALGH